MNAPTRDLKAKLWERDPDDFYCEPFWCSVALFNREAFDGPIVDPACGLGRIVHSARMADYEAYGADKVKRSEACGSVLDFLDRVDPIANVVSNPPFGIADSFVMHALALTTGKVAMLLPATWHFGAKRAAWLKTTPLRRIYALTPRPSMPPGAVILSGVEPGGGTKDFAWYIWLRGSDGPVEAAWINRDEQHGAVS